MLTIIGEKINGTIPSVKEAIAEHNEELIRERVRVQVANGADYLDCAPATDTAIEYETMKWLVDIIQSETDTPLSIDSPDVMLLKRCLEENICQKPGIVNSVNEEGIKCETIFPMIAGTDWNVLGLTCDQDGIPLDSQAKVDIAKRIIDKADHYGVALSNLHIDPCVMSLATVSNAMSDFVYCIQKIHEYAPTVKVTGAISNISFGSPARKYLNMDCVLEAMDAGLDSAILDPASPSMMGIIYAHEAMTGKDKGGRKYNRAFRKGIIK